MLHYHLGKSIGGFKLYVLSYWLDHRDVSHDNENVVLLKPEFLAAWVMKEMVFKDKE